MDMQKFNVNDFGKFSIKFINNFNDLINQTNNENKTYENFEKIDNEVVFFLIY